MDIEEIRRRIEFEESEIRRNDSAIRSEEESIKTYEKYAERDLRDAAKGGDLLRTADECRKSAEGNRADADKHRGRLRNIEREREMHVREMNKYKRMLSESAGSSAGRPASVQDSYRAPSPAASRNRYSDSGSSIRRIDRDKLKDAMTAAFGYALIVVLISFVSRLFFLARIAGLIVIAVGPVLFAVFAAKKLYNAGEPKRGAKIFIAYCLSLMMTLVCMEDINIRQIIIAAVAAAAAALILERMAGAK